MKTTIFSWARLFLPVLLATILISVVFTAVSNLSAAPPAKPSFQPIGAGTFTVTGTVTSTTMPMGVPNVQIFAFSGEITGETTTTAQGLYTLTLTSGIFYDIVFNPPGGAGLASQFVRAVDAPQTINMTLPPGFTISGTVYEDSSKTVGVENTAIYAFNTTTFSGFGLPPSTANGNYQISLEEGNWDLTFTPPHFSGFGPTQTNVTLTSNIILDIILQPGFTVYGTISNASAEPIANVEIFARDFSQPNGFGFTPSNGNGHYTGTLPSGNFDILFIPPPFQGLGVTVITDVAGPPDLMRDLTLSAGFTLSGTVLSENCTEPIANAFISATPHTPGLIGQFDNVGKFSGADGRYALPLPPGSYTITIEAPSGLMLPPTIYAIDLSEDTYVPFSFCKLYLPTVFK
ncbi:carboxypeptidase-like regulatory domain-containing protein [Candidatus Leptofilum sp.]|uniref:carboxypeptidase-like regulatory domain-containing protein n=1 Tax=Candidatus Leptofilum sp. TaxID=3241576 RepID=UPI003B59F211